jgi:hypothetical protein
LLVLERVRVPTQDVIEAEPAYAEVA